MNTNLTTSPPDEQSAAIRHSIRTQIATFRQQRNDVLANIKKQLASPEAQLAFGEEAAEFNVAAEKDFA
jgi:hypothetical protein